MYSSGDGAYGQQPPAGGRTSAPAGGGYGYAPGGAGQPAAAGGAYGYAPPAAGYGSGGGGAYDPAYVGGGYDAAGGYARGGWAGYGGAGGAGGGGRFAAVRLRGLPFGVREFEVATFLGLDPVDVLIVHRGGRPSGEAFAVLSHPAELDAAMRKNKAYMGSRYIEVFEARKGDYYRAVADAVAEGGGGGYGGGGGGGYPPRGRGGPPGSPRDRSRSPLPRGGAYAPGSSKIVKLRGLPFSAGVADVVDFFDDPALGLAAPPGEADVDIAVGGDGRPSGMAFVQFGSEEEAAAALRKDRQSIGSRYIELFPSSEEERARYAPR